MQDLVNYAQALQHKLERVELDKEPKGLYDPINYILSIGGKRIRPLLTLLSCSVFEGEVDDALSAALAVELFHNFSLIHDDIMDEAPLRRGKATVHQKWDVNTGILSGDAMLILAYQYFEDYSPDIFQELAKLFSKTAIEVCEGQQYDVDFEKLEAVSVEKYLKMIKYKTAVLVGASLQMGAIIAKTSTQNKKDIYDFGISLGLAFQLQDDYLDAFGDPKMFGKQIGGDIIANKKTMLYIKALENASDEVKRELLALYTTTPDDPTQKIKRVKEAFIETKAADFVSSEIERYTNKAIALIEGLEISEKHKETLISFSHNLMNRKV